MAALLSNGTEASADTEGVIIPNADTAVVPEEKKAGSRISIDVAVDD